ncbi:MAG: DNA/RNA nuclease SfsA [bacterium]
MNEDNNREFLRAITKPKIGVFRKRLNRFAADVCLEGKTIKAFLPNTGRLEELLIPETRVVLEKRREGGKTQFDMLLIETFAYPSRNPIWVNLDSRLPPKLLAKAIEMGLISEFEGTKRIYFEPAYPGGRFDLLLETERGRTFIETKSVNLVDSKGTARFPDATTTRGTKHIRALLEKLAKGDSACIAFIVTRGDALAFSPFAERDSEFAETLFTAKQAGVRVAAYHFDSGTAFSYLGEIPVELPAKPFPGFWPNLD